MYYILKKYRSLGRQNSMQVHLSRPDITNKETAAVNEVIRSPILALGPKMLQFERVVAEYAGRKRAIAVNGGISAFHLLVWPFGM